MQSEVLRITRDIAARSRTLRDQYRRDMDLMAAEPVHRSQLSCGNLAHGVAAGSDDKSVIKMMDSANIGIVTAYNDMFMRSLRRVSRKDQISPESRGVHGTGGGRGPGHVRWRDPGTARDGAEPVQPGRHRAGDRRLALPPDV